MFLHFSCIKMFTWSSLQLSPLRSQYPLACNVHCLIILSLEQWKTFESFKRKRCNSFLFPQTRFDLMKSSFSRMQSWVWPDLSTWPTLTPFTYKTKSWSRIQNPPPIRCRLEWVGECGLPQFGASPQQWDQPALTFMLVVKMVTIMAMVMMIKVYLQILFVYQNGGICVFLLCFT